MMTTLDGVFMGKICKIDGCNKKTNKNTVCPMHYSRYQRFKSYEKPNNRIKKKLETKCRLENCEKQRLFRNTLCVTHLGRWKRYKSYDAPIKILKSINDTKICKIHGELTKENTIFKKQYQQCRKCKQEYEKKRGKAKYLKQRTNVLFYHRKKTLKKYGLTLKDYDDLLKKQNYVCAICKKENEQRARLSTKNSSLTVDHCHKTGKIRGLLCHQCNLMLGNSNDEPEILRIGALYLENE